jgi:hypothetical protein
MAVAYCHCCAADPAPPIGWGCHKPSKDCCQCPEQHVHWWQEGGGGNGGGRIEWYNNDNDNVGLNAAAGEVVDDVPVTAATIGGAAQLLAAASLTMVQ